MWNYVAALIFTSCLVNACGHTIEKRQTNSFSNLNIHRTDTNLNPSNANSQPNNNVNANSQQNNNVNANSRPNNNVNANSRPNNNVNANSRPNNNVNANSQPTTTPNLHLHPETQESTIIDAIQELALDISASQWDQRVNSNNLVMSPVSIGALLNLVLLGTRGNSHAELKRVLFRFPNAIPDSIIHETYQKVLGSINQTTEGVNASMNSRLFLQMGMPIIGAFSQVSQALYNTQVRGLDFENDPSGAQNEVNTWVEESTNGKITNLIDSPFKPSTKFVAANTIYFNGAWKFPFSKVLTFDGVFNTGTKNITMPMMVNLLTVPFLKGGVLGFDMISLPYEGGKYTMVIMTPTGRPGIQSLQAIEYALDPANIVDKLMKQMSEAKVSVSIPRMSLKHKTYLKSDLTSLGAKDIFNPIKADFGRLSSLSGIYLDDVVHEAVLEITETGTVASAATATTFDRMGGNSYFKLDRPSLIFIKDAHTGLTLFYSRVVEPEPIIL